MGIRDGLRDYWMCRHEPECVRGMLPASRGVLAWFASHQRPDGSLGPLPWWNYVDWVRGWRNGVPPVAADGGSSAIIDLLLLAGYQWGADLERSMGSKGLAAEYDQRAATLAGTIRKLYWDPDRGLFADTPEKKSYSQHQNAFAILTGLVKGNDAERLAAKMIDDRSLTQSTLYFRYYIHSAMLKAGLGDRFLDHLVTWRGALKIGRTAGELRGCGANGVIAAILHMEGAEAIDDTGEPAEPDLQVAIQPQAGRLLHGLGQQFRATEGVGGVDLVAAMARDRHVGVTGDRDDRGFRPVVGDVDEHD